MFDQTQEQIEIEKFISVEQQKALEEDYLLWVKILNLLIVFAAGVACITMVAVQGSEVEHEFQMQKLMANYCISNFLFFLLLTIWPKRRQINWEFCFNENFRNYEYL